MTKDQEHLVTMLIIKYGGFEAVVDMWLYDDDSLTKTEGDAVNAWLACERIEKPLNATCNTDNGCHAVIVDFPLDLPDND